MDEQKPKRNPNKTNRLLFGSGLVLVGLLIGAVGLAYTYPNGLPYMHGERMALEDHHVDYLEHEAYMHDALIDSEHYACCLEKPCHTCLSLDPYHGEGASCTCLEDVVNGKAPCGECTGGILAGRGNKYLAEYFAASLADEVGEEHLETMQRIIEDTYGLDPEEHACPVADSETGCPIHQLTN